MKLVAIILLLCITTFAQKPKVKPTPKPTPQATSTPMPCDLKIQQLPAIRNLKIGMSQDEVKSVLFTSEHNDFGSKVDEIGVTNEVFFSQFNQGIKPEVLTQVRILDLTFLDKTLIAINIDYNNSIEWNSIDEFVNKIRESLNLPEFAKSDYVTPSTVLLFRELRCIDFSIIIQKREINYSLRLMYLPAQEQIKQRENELKEKKKKTFKP